MIPIPSNGPNPQITSSPRSNAYLYPPILRSISSELHEIAAEDLPLTKKITQISLHQLKQAVLFERAIRLGERLVDRPGEKAQFDKVVKEFVEISNNTRGR